KKKGGQFKTHFPNEIASKLQSAAPEKENTYTPFPETHKKSLEPFSKKDIPGNHLAKKTIGAKSSTKPNQVVQPEKSRIVLMDIDPYSLHAYWEITNIDKKRVLKQFDESSKPPRQIIRVYDVTYIHFDGKNAHSYFDIEINRNRGSWYIDLWSSHKSLCAEIGMKSSRGNFYPIARSNFINTPRAYQSSPGKEQWMRVTENYEEISMLPAKSQKEENKPEDAFHTPSSTKKVESKYIPPSVEKDSPQEETVVKKDSTPTSQQSYKEDIPPERRLIKIQEKGSHDKKKLFTKNKTIETNIKTRILENDVKIHYSNLQFIPRRQVVKTKTPPVKNPLHQRVGSSKKDFEQEFSPEINTHYGSDIRWEKEIKKKGKRNG
ncbi:MAG: DUF4912 domain-containing protein, partial [Deltaproteobacteria bacterium]|nr:DUF4912 domain-containing protein [Deltaproteobacteria bacterium]